MSQAKIEEISTDVAFYAGLRRLIKAAHLDEFHNERQWLDFGNMRVYIRANQRFITGRRQKCLTIANVSTDAQFQRKGLFTALIRCIRAGTALPLLVEEAHPAFAEALVRHGWKIVTTSPLAYNLVKYD